MRVLADGFTFEFPEALDAFVFDQQDKSKAHFHGLSHAMKAVDLVIELSETTLFIEVKDFAATPDGKHKFSDAPNDQHQKLVLDICKGLTQKFRDTWLYRWAQRPVGSPDKPIYYVCLVTLESALLTPMQKALEEGLPLKQKGARWHRPIAQGCSVVNLERWNSLFPTWPLHRSDD